MQNEQKNNSGEGKDFVHLKISKPMGEVVKEYCEKASVNHPDYSIGFICGTRQDLAKHIESLCHTFFFAGVHMGITDKKNVKLMRLDAEGIVKVREKCIKDMEKQKMENIDTNHIG